MAVAQASAPQVTVIDGWLYDSESGECLGPAELPKPEFAITDDESLNWVLNKFLQTEATIAAIDNNDAVVHARAVIANAEAMKKEQQNRLNGLHFRFDNEIEHYVKPLLDGKKSKTHKTLFGSVSFRTSKGGLRVKDAAAALQWVKEQGNALAHTIKTTEEFQISRLTDEERETLANIVPEGFDVKPDSESMAVKTGVQS